jgi:hypothetical protein
MKITGAIAVDGVYFIVLASRIPINGETTLNGMVYLRR